MGDNVAVGALLTAGLKDTFARAYEPNYEGVKAALGPIMWLGATSDKLKEYYGYIESAPHPVRWDKGSMIESKGMKSVQFTVTNRDWGRRIKIHDNDIQDDQTGFAWTQARNLGSNWAYLPERVFFQMIQNATDADLLPAVPNAGDGTAIYSASTRFGASGGNQVSETGTTTAEQCLTDIMKVYRRYAEFKDTEAVVPLWNASQINKMHIFFAPSVVNVMLQAITQTMVLTKITGSSTTDVSVAAGTDNVLKTAGLDITYTANVQITDTSRYFFLRDLPDFKKAIFQQVRQPFFEAIGNWETSDYTRGTGFRYVQFKSREGYGSPVPYATIKLT
jgi:hypothetical protein